MGSCCPASAWQPASAYIYHRRPLLQQDIQGDTKWHGFSDFGFGGSLGKGFLLAVPCDDPARSPNHSAYKVDSALWMACHQSRKALERHFCKNECWSELPMADCPTHLACRGDYAGQAEASHTASYIDRDSKANHITILPGKDLVHLVPVKPFNLQ